MSAPAPLAKASARLRVAPPAGMPGRPGRPRKALEPGHTSGHTVSEAAASADSTREKTPSARGTQARQAGALAPLTPRLLGLRDAGTYLGGISAWAVRQLVASGRLTPVRAELAPGRPLHRLLLDVRELDAVADSWAPR